MVGMTGMYIDRSILAEYPFSGAFYKYGVDDSLPLDEQEETETLVLETQCDIQETQKSFSSGNITASFNVYFPFDKEKGIEIKRGMKFRGSLYGLEVNGTVVGVFPTQMGGCVCYISDKYV